MSKNQVIINMSDTPRTAKESYFEDGGDQFLVVRAEFAKELERENARLEHFLSGEKIARQYAIDKGVELEIENKTLRAQVALDHRAKGLMLMESQRQIDCILFVYSRDREIKCLSADEARDNQKQMFADGWKHTSTIHPARWIEALINHPEGLDAESTRLMDELQFGVSALPNV